MNVDDTDDSKRDSIEHLLKRPVTGATRAVWGFTNRSDFVTLAGGDHVVVQRYRRRRDAEHRLRVMRALWTPAAEAGIVIPRVREFDLDADPPWVIFDALPGVPVPEAGGAGLEGPRFPEIARSMGKLLVVFRRLPTAGLELDDLWTDPSRLAAARRAGPGRPRRSAQRSGPRWPISSSACLPCLRGGRLYSPTAISRR
jgi:hypothetical protein